MNIQFWLFPLKLNAIKYHYAKWMIQIGQCVCVKKVRKTMEEALASDSRYISEANVILLLYHTS